MQAHELESVQTAISDLFDALSDLYSQIPDPDTSPEAALLEIAFDDVEALDGLVEILNDDSYDTSDEDDIDDEDFDDEFGDEDLDEDDLLTDEIDDLEESECGCPFCECNNF